MAALLLVRLLVWFCFLVLLPGCSQEKSGNYITLVLAGSPAPRPDRP